MFSSLLSLVCLLFSTGIGCKLPISSTTQKEPALLRIAPQTLEGTEITQEGETVILSLGEVDVLEQECLTQTLKLTRSSEKSVIVERLFNPCGCLRSSLMLPSAAKRNESGGSRDTNSSEQKGNGSKTESPVTLPFVFSSQAEMRLSLVLDLRMLTPGPFQKTLLVYATRSGEQVSDVPVLRILVQGHLRSTVTFTPTQVLFSQIQAGKEKSCLVTVQPDPRLVAAGEVPALMPHTNLRTLGAEIKVEKIAASSRPDADKQPLRYRILVPADAPIGSLLGVLTFEPAPDWEKDHPKEAAAWRQVALPCSGLVVGDISASPQIAVFGAVAEKESTVETCEVRLIEQKAGALTGAVVRSDNPALQATITGGREEEKTLTLRLRRNALSSSAGTVPSGQNNNADFRLLRVVVTLRNGQRLVIPIQVFLVAKNGGQR